MVLHGNDEGFSPPFDASLFGASYSPGTPGAEYEIEYAGCEALAAFFTVDGDVRPILPEGVEPFSDPTQAGLLIAHYPFSTVGEYHEVIATVQVENPAGGMAYYIPYIYVTNDAAMAAGRELAGAPKKLATIDLTAAGSTRRGTLQRPEGRQLLTVTATPERRARGGFVDTILPSPTPLLSVRHLPPIEGGDGCTQLVEWYADMEFHTDEAGDRKVWSGPTDVAYGDHSEVDPIDKLGVEEVLTGLYAEFDMTLGATAVRREYEV